MPPAQQAFFLWAALACGLTVTRAQAQGRLEGQVIDSVSRRPVDAAEVSVRGTGLRATTTVNGRFVFVAVPPGVYTVDVRRIGFATAEVAGVSVVTDSTATLRLALVPIALRLAEVVVTPGSFSVMGSQSTRQAMSRVDIENTPQLGEDIFRAVSRLPGLTSGDYTAHFSIRGGRHEETLILLDGLELYEPYHLKDFNDGAISIIDVETVDGVELMTGGFSAKYGDRRSGVFNIRSRQPEDSGTKFSVGASLINARVNGEGTFAGGKGSWLVSGRRGYLDLLLGAIKSNDLPSPTYADAFTAIRFQVHPKHGLALYALWSSDGYRFNAASTTGFNDSIPTREIAGNHYGNSYLWLTATSLFGTKLLVRSIASVASVTGRRQGTEFRLTGPAIYDISGHRDFSVSGFKQDATYELSNALVFEAGYDVRRLEAKYALSNLVYQSPDDPSPDTSGFYPHWTDTALVRKGTTLGAYISTRVRPVSPLTLEIGWRYEQASYTGDRDWSPRVSAMVRLGASTTLRAGWGHYRQHQSIDDLATLSGLGRYFPSELSTQVTVGLEHVVGSTVWRIEGYRKLGSHLRPVFRNWKNSLNTFPETDEDRILVYPEASTSKGVEVYLARDLGKGFSIRSSYGYAIVNETTFRIDNVNVPVPLRFATTHPWPQDQRHSLNVALAYRPQSKWSLQADYVFHSGWPTTLESLQPVSTPQGTDYVSRPEVLYGSRLAAYHRLDLRVVRRVTSARGSFRLFFEVNNVTNHQNAFGYDYFRERASNGAIVLTRDVEVGFPILPSIGVAWSWNLSRSTPQN